MPNPKVQFMLRTRDIDPDNSVYVNNFPKEPTGDYTNPKTNDFLNRWRTRMRFNRINLRSILGNLYEKGASYNLKLESVNFHLSSNGTVFSTAEQDRIWNIFLRGFPFTKSWVNGNQMSEVMLCNVRVPSGGQSYSFYFNNSNEFTFEITDNLYSDELVLELELRDMLTNNVEPTASMWAAIPHSQYIFSISKC